MESPEQIIEMLDILDAKVKYIYLTHCHGDHIRGLKQVKEAKGGKILIRQIRRTHIIKALVYVHIEWNHQRIEADSRVDDGVTYYMLEI